MAGGPYKFSTADEFQRLRTSSDPAEYNLAATGAAPAELWFDVIASYPEMKEWVAHNKTVPLEILRILSTDSDRDVRLAVAMKRKLDLPLFDLLSADPDEGVRAALAHNAKVPNDVYQRLLD